MMLVACFAMLLMSPLLSCDMAMLAVLYQGSTLVLSGAMSLGDLTSFLLYSIYVGFSFTGISSLYGNLMRASGASERV